MVNTHNFVVERLREILANLESSSQSERNNNSLSSAVNSTAYGSIKGTGVIPDLTTQLVNEGAELENLARSLTSNTTQAIIYGHESKFPGEVLVEREASTVFGVEVREEEPFDLGRKGLLFPTIMTATSESSSTSLMKHLQELIQVLKMGSSSGGTSSGRASNSLLLPYGSNSHLEGPGGLGGIGRKGSGGGREFELNLTLDDIADLNSLMTDYGESSMPLKHVLIIVLYLLIACVAIIGNLLVVQLVIRSRRLHTLTHALLANLAVADLFMATLNIPFSAARVIMAEWPFGSFLCQTVPFVQVTSVYVTSITMAVIAVDRYQVIMNPLGRRMKNSQGIVLGIAIWSLSAVLSLPFALHHKVVTVLTVRVVNRCQAEFPSMETRRWLTVATVLAQYLIPLAFTTASYISIMMRLGLRSTAMGSTTPRQVAAQSKAKRKTIKMLVLTVIFFAVCWAPINAYHLLTHFGLAPHNSTAILTCHLIAMSSTCYNPFIYCWLNEHFRREALKWLRCFRTATRRPSILLTTHNNNHQPGLEIQLRSDGERSTRGANTVPAAATQPMTLIQLLTFRTSSQPPEEQQESPMESILTVGLAPEDDSPQPRNNGRHLLVSMFSSQSRSRKNREERTKKKLILGDKEHSCSAEDNNSMSPNGKVFLDNMELYSDCGDEQSIANGHSSDNESPVDSPSAV